MKGKTIGLIVWVILTSVLVTLFVVNMGWEKVLFIFLLVFWSIVAYRTKLFTQKPIIRDLTKCFKKHR